MRITCIVRVLPPLTTPPARKFVHAAPGQRERVDPGVPTETLVLGGDRGGREPLRNGVARRKAPLPVRRDACAQERPVAGLQDGRYRVVEERFGEPGGQSGGHDEADRQAAAENRPRMPPRASRRLRRDPPRHRSPPSPSTTRTPIPLMRPYTEASYIASADTAGR